MSIPQTFLQDLIARTDIVEVVGRHVTLRRAGANYMGLCPFHGEKSPSFSVSPSKQFYHCFGCGKNGNAISFLMEHTGMGFREAVQDLAQTSGMTVPEEESSPQERARAAAQREKQATLTDVLEKAAQAYRQWLKETPHAIDYLRGREVSGLVARRYGLGYAPGGSHALSSVFPRYDDPQLVESGLVILSEDGQRRHDRFRDRVMFPIRNIKGECIGFGGRVLGDEKPKYLNSPETPVFHKGQELYGLFEGRNDIRAQGYALVVEGYMDVVALAQWNFGNAVASLGTACTPDHVRKLMRFTDNVVFSFDGDAAGQRAAAKALESALPFATDTRSFRFLFLPQEHDPDSFIRTFGTDGFARHVHAAVPLSRFLVETASQSCDLGTPEGRARMCSRAQPLWTALPDGALKRQLLSELAALAQLDARDLTDLWSGQSQAARAANPQRKPYADRKRRDSNRFASSSPQGVSGFFRAPPAALGTFGEQRVEQSARLLLSHMHFWESLTDEDHALLGHLPLEYGPLFVWLESRFYEHGAQPWALLREALRGHECERLATQLMHGVHSQPEGQEHELFQELRGILDRMLAVQLREEEKQALNLVTSDPSMIDRYRVVQKRRVTLEKILVPGISAK